MGRSGGVFSGVEIEPSSILKPDIVEADPLFRGRLDVSTREWVRRAGWVFTLG